MHTWIIAHEAIWLFWILAAELLVGLSTLGILLIEYYYDKSVIESKSKKKKVTKNRVTIKVSKDGQAVITEQPKNVDVTIEHDSKEE